MYDKILRFMEALLEFFSHPVDTEMFSATLKIYHEVRRNKHIPDPDDIYSLAHILHYYAGALIERDTCEKIIKAVDNEALYKWHKFILHYSIPSYTSSSNTMSSSS